MLTTGFSRGDIVRTLSDEWQCSERQVDNYIAKARVMLEEDCQLARPAYLAELLGRLRSHEKNAAKRGQYQVAVNAAMNQAKLVGLEGA